MRKAGWILGMMAVLAGQSSLRAAELKIVDVRRNIPLADDEPVYKDFYINGGAKDGLKPNLVVTAIRKTSIRDASGTQSLGELAIPVAQIRVVYVADNLAVAREYKVLSRDELPMLEQIGVMSGDVLDLKGSFVDKRKPSSAAVTQPGTAASTVNNTAPALTPPAPAAQAPTAPVPARDVQPMKAIIGSPKNEASAGRTKAETETPRAL
ncbi:MAG: hypothetical protein KF767_02395 [Bdellovibrionaceae bacterium]|nr:hypothetical protein [Pseudobdellovibrionaceae bacterium]